MNAAAIAAALGARAEAVCRRYLPHGRKQGRYWVAGDLDGARGRSLYVRLAGPGTPGKFTDCATGQHGDLLDLIRHRSRAPTLRAALDEARAFLALEPAPDPVPGAAPAAGEGDSYDAAEAARRLWRRCRAIDGTHAERYLHARGLARCRFAALRFHSELRYREGSTVRRLPALVAAVTGDDGAVTGVQRTWLDARSPARAGVAIAAQGARAGLRTRRALRHRPRRRPRFARRRRGHRDGAVRRHRHAGHHRRGGAVRREPRRVRAAARRRAPCHRARQRHRRRAAADRLARRCARAGVAACVVVPEGGDFNDDLVDARSCRARRAARPAPPLRGSGRPAGRSPQARQA